MSYLAAIGREVREELRLSSLAPMRQARYTEAEKDAMTPWQREEAQERLLKEWALRQVGVTKQTAADTKTSRKLPQRQPATSLNR